jgi:hypothetical protein
MYLVQMMLRYWFAHEGVHALCQCAVEYQIGTCAVSGADTLVVE